MNNEYIVVTGGAVIGDSSQHGPAVRTAEAAAASDVGAEVVVYRRVNVYKARTIVENDAPVRGLFNGGSRTMVSSV